MDETSDWITGAAAAAILGVDPSTVSRWSADSLKPEARKLTPVAVIGGYRLFRRADVEALAAALAAERAS